VGARLVGGVELILDWVSLSVGEDSWSQKHNLGEEYSVKLAYQVLSRTKVVPGSWVEEELGAVESSNFFLGNLFLTGFILV